MKKDSLKELRFSSQLFAFLRELKEHNNREWFEANKQRYLDDVRDPYHAFIAAFKPRLAEISPQLVADPKRSLFRIYRDIRFAKNKAPYKTAASAFFWHQADKDAAPGFYLHLESGQCFMGCGLWHPEPALRRLVTDAIVAQADEWRRAITEPTFKKRLKFGGESLSRLPKYYDETHPFAVDLQRKDFIVAAEFSEKQACATDFLDTFTELCRVSAPFVAFLTRAVGLPWSFDDKPARAAQRSASR